ncbi:MAG: hypothetical protein WCB19_02540 [Thermoplasmata archaeon]
MARLRRISAVRKEDLLDRAKALRGSVEPLLPKLTAECPPDRFDRLRSELEEVRTARDEKGTLERLARRGDPLARAYAGLLKFYLAPEALVVATFPLPNGSIPYAPLARTEPEMEVAVQHSDDQERLLIGYLDWTRKGFHFFATSDRLWCTGRSAEPPPEFRSAKIAGLPYRFVADPEHHFFGCAHLAEGEPRPYIEVGWPGAGTRFRVCERCAKPDRHLLSSLSDGIAVPDPGVAFPVTAELNVHCRAGPECVHAHLPELPRGLRQLYEKGRLGDADLLREYLSELRPRIERTSRPTFVANSTCYGSNLDGFLTDLHPTPVERRALESVLRDTPGYFSIDRATAGQALEQLWPAHAEVIVRSIVQDADESQKLIDELRGAPPGRVAEVLKRVQRLREEREVLEALPRYRGLSPPAEYVDRVARMYRTHGEADAERALFEFLPREGNVRGLAFALLLALGRAQSHIWQFSESEQKFGTFLSDAARATLAAPPDAYHDALGRLFLAAGVAEWGTRTDG